MGEGRCRAWGHGDSLWALARRRILSVWVEYLPYGEDAIDITVKFVRLGLYDYNLINVPVMKPKNRIKGSDRHIAHMSEAVVCLVFSYVLTTGKILITFVLACFFSAFPALHGFCYEWTQVTCTLCCQES